METKYLYFFFAFKLLSAYIVYIIHNNGNINTHIFLLTSKRKLGYPIILWYYICAIENGIRTYSDFHLSRVCAIPFSTIYCNFVDLFLSRKSNQRNYCFENDVGNIDLRLQIFIIISKFPEEIHFHIHSNHWEPVTLRFYRTARSSICICTGTYNYII